MSFEHVVAAYNIDTVLLSPGEKFTLITLASYADHDGRCWPSYTTLAAKTGYARRTVMRHLQSAVEKGLLVKKDRHRDDGADTSNLYVLTLGAGCHDVTGDGHDVTGDGHDVTGDGHDVTGDGHDVTGEGDSASPGQCGQCRPPGDTGSPATTLEMSREMSKENNVLSSTCPQSVHGDAPETGGTSTPYKAVVDWWNALAERLDLSRVLWPISEKRRRKITQRLREWREFEEANPHERVLACLAAEVEDSSFLRGRSERGWQVTLDFLIANDNNWRKILEGQYRDGPGDEDRMAELDREVNRLLGREPEDSA